MKTIQDLIIPYFTRENITFFLALFGSIGTALQAFFHFLSTRKKVKMQILDSRYVYQVIQFLIYIQNQSNAPICISSISICYDEKELFCELIPKKIRGKDDSLICTPMFPLNLSPLEGSIHYLEFINCPKISLDPGKTLDFVIYTNRGPLKKSVALDKPSHYLHIEKKHC